MRRPIAKLGFIHRRLWAQDASYRAAFLAGPPPLVGLAVAAAVWAGMHMIGRPAEQAGSGLPWAHYVPPVAAAAAGMPIVALPDDTLPAIQADGRPAGLTTGWKGQVLPVTVSAAFDVNVLPTPLATFSTDQAGIDLDRVVAAGPPGGLFVGEENALLVIRTAGVYALSIRLDRASDRSADCLQRFGFARRRLVSNLRLDVSGSYTHAYDPTPFDLRPGLYRISVAAGCWRARQAVGPGRLTVLIRHPGDQASSPARPDEILRFVAPD